MSVLGTRAVLQSGNPYTLLDLHDASGLDREYVLGN